MRMENDRQEHQKTADWLRDSQQHVLDRLEELERKLPCAEDGKGGALIQAQAKGKSSGREEADPVQTRIISEICTVHANLGGSRENDEAVIVASC
jgi:hypothetical protein